MAVHRSVTPLVVNGGATSRGSAGSASVGRVVGVDALGVGDPAEGGEADGVTAPPGVDVGSAGVLVEHQAPDAELQHGQHVGDRDDAVAVGILRVALLTRVAEQSGDRERDVGRVDLAVAVEIARTCEEDVGNTGGNGADSGAGSVRVGGGADDTRCGGDQEARGGSGRQGDRRATAPPHQAALVLEPSHSIPLSDPHSRTRCPLAATCHQRMQYVSPPRRVNLARWGALASRAGAACRPRRAREPRETLVAAEAMPERGPVRMAVVGAPAGYLGVFQELPVVPSPCGCGA